MVASDVPVDWMPAAYPHGAGLVAAAGGNRWELVPYAAGDGSGRIGGYALVEMERRSGFPRFPAPAHDLDSAAIAAAPLIRRESGP